MSLMQEILDKIERDAKTACAQALSQAGLITEAEVLRDTLCKHGADELSVSFIAYGGITLLDHHPDGRLRRAIAAAGMAIESERVPATFGAIQPANTRTTELKLHGLDCKIWVCRDPIPLAAAA